ncbi:MAG: DUF1573 domain-containing protein [Planctomycetota bacterium]|jgi:hypothetical protein
MKPNRSISTILIVTCGLLLQAGCEEEAMAPRELGPDWFERFEQPTRPTTATRTTRASSLSPSIAFEKVVHDFGNVGPETGTLCEFRFTNVGNSTLKIGDVSKACGCTPFLLTKKEYAPGESGTLKVKYYSDTQLGPVTKQLVVHSNDQAQPEVTLAIKAMVMAKVDYEPKTLSLLLKQENAGCPKITLTSTDGQPFSISHFKSTADCVTVDYNPSVKATTFVLEPKVDMAKLEKTLRGRIEIGLTHPECKTVSLGLNTLAKFKVAPGSIVVRGADPKDLIVKKVRILNNYNEDFVLESTSSKNGTITVLSNEVVRNGFELELQIKPPAAGARTRVFTETLFVNIKGGEQLKIPLSVFYSRTTPAPLTSTEDPAKCKNCGQKILYAPTLAKNKGS